MLDWFKKESDDAISLLKRDHDTVKELFTEFEKAEGLAAKRKIVEKAIDELKVHATLEEEIFYPKVREQMKDGLMAEAVEEHHVAKLLIAELEKMDPHNEHFEAKFKVLSESVRHHIKEEEGEMLPRARQFPIDFDELGRVMLERKHELMTRGVPKEATAAEEAMVSAVRLGGDAAAKPKTKRKAAVAKKRAPKKMTAR